MRLWRNLVSWLVVLSVWKSDLESVRAESLCAGKRDTLTKESDCRKGEEGKIFMNIKAVIILL